MLSSGKRGFEERLRFFYVPQDTQTLKKGDKLLQNRVFAQKKTLVVDCLWDIFFKQSTLEKPMPLQSGVGAGEAVLSGRAPSQ